MRSHLQILLPDSLSLQGGHREWECFKARYPALFVQRLTERTSLLNTPHLLIFQLIPRLLIAALFCRSPQIYWSKIWWAVMPWRRRPVPPQIWTARGSFLVGLGYTVRTQFAVLPPICYADAFPHQKSKSKALPVQHFLCCVLTGWYQQVPAAG